MTKKLFKFEYQNLLMDATNDKGIVTRYKTVFVIKELEERKCLVKENLTNATCR